MTEKSTWKKVLWTDATHQRVARPNVVKPLPPLKRLGDGKKAPPREEINVWIPQRYKAEGMMAKAEKEFKRKVITRDAEHMDAVFEGLYGRADLKKRNLDVKREKAYKRIAEQVPRRVIYGQEIEDVNSRLYTQPIAVRESRHAAAIAEATAREPGVQLSSEEMDAALVRLYDDAIQNRKEMMGDLEIKFHGHIDRTFVAKPAPVQQSPGK